MTVEISMPKMGMSMQAGTLIEWLKKEGNAVTIDDPIARIEMDKVATDLEAAGNGILLYLKSIPAGMVIKSRSCTPSTLAWQLPRTRV